MISRGNSRGNSEKRALVAALFESHYSRIARYIAIRIGDAVAAEDLASEVFERALRSVDNYKETGAPMEAWIFRIASNLSIDYLRSIKRRPAPFSLDEHRVIQDGTDPDDNLIRQDEIDELNSAMQHLSESQRQVLSMRFGGEMTSEQVAATMNKKPGAVRQMQFDAIKKLRQILTRGKS